MLSAGNIECLYCIAYCLCCIHIRRDFHASKKNLAREKGVWTTPYALVSAPDYSGAQSQAGNPNLPFS